MNLIPESWLPSVKMKRIICHWTAGTYKPSANDRSHYHLLIDGEGQLHRGDHSIAQNHRAARGGYAAHTYGLNPDSIGVSVCCMGGAKGKRHLGPYPLTKTQWEVLAQVVAQLCLAYDLEPTEREVLQHGDVHRVYGIDQWGKWDINFLPWDPSLSHDDVGHQFRHLVKQYLKNGLPQGQPTGDAVTVLVNGVEVPATVVNGVTMASARAVAEALGAEVSWDPHKRAVTVTSPLPKLTTQLTEIDTQERLGERFSHENE